MQFFLIILLFFMSSSLRSQTKSEWKEGYKLSVLDFQSEPPKVRENQNQTYYLAANLDFNNQKSNNKSRQFEHLYKNVTALFYPSESWLQQGEGTETLLKFAQMEFDLLELYARKYRKRVNNDKYAFSNPNFFQRAYKEVMIQKSKRQLELQNAIAESDNKRDAFHDQILKEINELAAFCRDCIPIKSK